MKHNSLRFLALVLCLLMAVSLCACGGSEEETGSDASGASSQSGTAAATAHIVQTKYETADTVIAILDVTDYGADPTGKEDSTEAIKKALSLATVKGGGTVWMPAGKYRITSSLEIPKLVTLRGDYQDPDKGTDYGTIILADVPSEDAIDTGLFIIAASAGVEGLTVYYPNQDIKNVQPYPFTFFGKAGMLKTIKNCTLINSYRGIGTAQKPGHEMLMIKNVKGTALKFGVSLNYSADVGTIDGMTFNPSYWAKAGSGLKTADAAAIAKWSKDNKAAGLEITDAEQQQYLNISISGYEYGVLFPCRSARMMGSGAFFNLKVTDCTYGVYAEDGTFKNINDENNILTNIDYRWGYTFSKSSLSGSKYAMYNGTPVLSQGRVGTMKLCDVKLDGPTAGAVQGNINTTSNGEDLSAVTVNTNRVTKTTGTAFKVLTSKEDSDSIQKTLDEVGKAGGGVVYCAAGKYYLKKALKVPANVELRGAAGSSQRIANLGTVFCIQMAPAASLNAAKNADAFVTLAGTNAGVSGICFFYQLNVMSLNKGATTYKSYAAAIGAKNTKQVWCTDCCIMCGNYGVEFENCDDYIVENLVACCTDETIHVSGNNGLVANCLQNATVIWRNDFVQMTGTEENGSDMWAFFNKVLRLKDHYITVGKGSGQQIVNCFIYGGNTCLTTNGATDLTVVNIGADNLGDPGTGLMCNMNGGSAIIVNSMRYNGDQLKNNRCDLKIRNRMSINLGSEPDVG